MHALNSRILTRASAQGSSATESATATTTLGSAGPTVGPVGIGAWAWGDRSGYWGGYDKQESGLAFKAFLESGMTLLDTAEVYGFGLSETYVGDYLRDTGATPVIATKFAPLPWRLSSGSVVSALKASLKRLGVPKVGLYMQHWPGFLVNAFSNDAYLEGLAECKRLGLCDSIGVSNFNLKRLQHSVGYLAARGERIASNQVQFSLLYRAPETSGLLEYCKREGITVMAYCPLAQGLLTGKYSPDNLPAGQRTATITAARLEAVQPLVAAMREIGAAHDGKTCAQVAVNYVLCKGALPIPGVKTAKQAKEMAGSFGWSLTEEEVLRLEGLAQQIPEAQGAPFENW